MILGIDLGTTNSACAIWRDGKASIVPNALGDALTPSVVGIDDDASILVGQAAKQRLVSHPESTVAYFKRLMGTDRQIELADGRILNAVELSSLILRSLKDDAERSTGQSVTHAVISVPAYFNDNQRQATRDAAELAGLTVNRLINEPTAAAIAHGLQQTDEQRFMVLDLGGGTFDVSIIEYFEGILEVHSTAGDSALGGEDFTTALVEYFLKKSGLQRDSLSATERQQLYARMETAKRQYRSNESRTVSFRHGAQSYEMSLDEAQFKSATAALLTRIRSPMARALQDAAIQHAQLDDIVLVGGATRMPVFRSMVATLFGRLPRIDRDPDLTVVHGAAIQAGLVAKDQSLDDIVLTDVCPFSLGVAAVNFADMHRDRLIFEPIIERNTVVPTSRQKTFHTIYDQQAQVEVRIYQGEHRLVRNNLLLETIKVPVPPAPAGQESMDVRFSYDVNGLLDVDVTVNSTGQSMNHLIENSTGRLTDKQKAASVQKLGALKFLPKERAEVRAILARAERLYATLLGSEREQVAVAMSEFEAVLSRQDDTEIRRVCKQFDAFLGQLDGDIWA